MTVLHAFFEMVGVALVFFTLPLILELSALSLAAFLPRHTAPAVADKALRLSVIIPAHNEEKLIGDCVSSLIRDAATNITVIAHNCTDATASVATAAGANVLALNDEGGGKGAALHYGFTQALAGDADALLVIDADSTVVPGLIGEVTRALAAGSGAVQCRYEVANPEATTRTRLMALSFLGMNVLRPLGRSRLGLSCGIFGNGFALSADTLRNVPYLANSIVEDLEYHLHLLRAGIRVDFLEAATVLGEMPDSSTASATQRTRWEGGRLRMRRQFSGPLLREIFSGRLAMLEPLLDLRSLPLVSEAVLLLASLALPLDWLRAYAAAGLASVALYIVVSATLSSSPSGMFKALVAAPGYVLWKLLLLPRTRLAARRDAAWNRTQRNSE